MLEMSKMATSETPLVRVHFSNLDVSVGHHPPLGLEHAVSSSSLCERFDGEGERLFVLAGAPGEHASLVVIQNYEPSAGFPPGVLYAEDTRVLFIGAGTRLLAYDLVRPRRIWEDVADIGFWGWSRHEDVICMSAECELAAWRSDATKLWSTFVEPPWDFRVEGEIVQLNVMDKRTSFGLRTGPERSG